MSLSSVFRSFFFPTYCVGCQNFGPLICPKCFETVDFLYQQPLPRLNPLYLDEVVIGCQFSGVIEKLIKAMKYQSVVDAGRLCGRLLYEYVSFPKAEAITSVPIHPKRLRERGFNQAEVIAESVSQSSAVPYQPLLIRTIHASNQARVKTMRDRQSHVAGHFALYPKATKLPKSVLLVDDVFTTGSTLNECAKVLRQRGVSKIIGLTVGKK